LLERCQKKGYFFEGQGTRQQKKKHRNLGQNAKWQKKTPYGQNVKKQLGTYKGNTAE